MDYVLRQADGKDQVPNKSVTGRAAALKAAALKAALAELYLTQMFRHILPGNRTFDIPTQVVTSVMTHTTVDPSLLSLHYNKFTNVIITFTILTTIFPRPDNYMRCFKVIRELKKELSPRSHNQRGMTQCSAINLCVLNCT